jgi:hypothetical protein
MSVATKWDTWLKEPGADSCEWHVDYGDLRALVDSALESERFEAERDAAMLALNQFTAILDGPGGIEAARDALRMFRQVRQ